MPIELHAYDPRWPERYQCLAAALRRELRSVAVRIDHVGSTSVPGLVAKDVIDIQIGVAALEPESLYREPLERLGYGYRLDGDRQHRLFGLDSAAGKRLSNVHVYEAGSGWGLDHLGFRDALRENGRLAGKYGDIKMLLARQYDDPYAFADAKGTFIQNVLAQRTPNRLQSGFTAQTERLQLREYSRADLEDTARLLGDPLVMRYYRSPKTRAESLAWIEWNLDNYRELGFGLWVMELHSTGEYVGDCSLTVQEIGGQKDVEVGYHVRSELWGQGFATEAATACREYARDRLRLRRLIAITHPKNGASRAVARKIGMAREVDYVSKGRVRLLYSMSLAPAAGTTSDPDGGR